MKKQKPLGGKANYNRTCDTMIDRRHLIQKHKAFCYPILCKHVAKSLTLPELYCQERIGPTQRWWSGAIHVESQVRPNKRLSETEFQL